MKDNSFNFSSRRVLFLAMVAGTLLVESPQSVYADVNNVQTVQQTGILKGQVVDVNGRPVIGASVIVKGNASKGTITDLDGNFSLANVTKGILIVSYVGYQSQEVSFDSSKTLKVILQEDSEMLDEVVVVGYGTSKKSDLTGSLTSVKSQDIEKMPVTNIATAMQGRVPGAIISSNNGNPGNGLKMRIRGANSINGNNDPLYIIDGVSGGINGLNVNDVESIEVLKDASATAIYGSRGANGVVLITTKRGTEGAPRIQLNANIGINNLPNTYEMMEAGDYATLVNSLKGSEIFTANQIAAYRQNGGIDWQDEIFQTGVTQDYQLSISGGNKNTSYYLSGNFVDQTGIVTNTSAQRYNFRSNVTTHFLDRFTLDMSLTASRSKGMNTTDNGSKGSPIWLAPIMSPTYSPYTEDGSWNLTRDNLAGPGAGYKNPLMILNERHSDYTDSGWGLNTKLTYDIFSDLKLDVVFSIGGSTNNKGVITNEYVSDSQTSASQTVTQYYGWQNSNILTYHKRFNKIHDLTVTAVNEQTWSDEKQVYAGGSGIDPITVGYDNLGIATDHSASSYRKEYTLQSFLGRVSYSLKDRYLLTASYRADGSSKFTKNNKWAYFPSAAVAWRISEEAFMKKQDVISNLKLRGSWGRTGNQGIDVYANISYYGNINHSFGQQSSFTGSANYGAYNPDLKWETTEQTNVGVDFGFFNGRLSLSADYYVKTTNDLLLYVALPYYNGDASILRNVGKVRNKGFEVTLSVTPVSTKNFSWDLNFNASSYKNKIISLGEEKEIMGTNPNNGMISESPFIIREGEALGSIYGYEWQGIYSEAEVAEAAKFGFKPGDNKYVDLDGDNAITSADRKIIGNSTPKFSWGLDNNFTYKNFSLNIMVQGVSGKKILNTMYAAASTVISDAPSITTKDGGNYWTASNQKAAFANPLSSTNKNQLVSTQFLQNGDYVKVKNIALSYLLKKKYTWFADLKFTVSAQNLLTFTKYKGYDPEVSTYGGDTEGALDMGAYPNPRTVTFGVQMNF